MAGLIFENIPQIILIMLIKSKWLNFSCLIKDQDEWAINLSLTFTIISIVLTVLTTYIESRSLKEQTLGYMMTKMTSNNRWIPYMHKIMRRDNDININYGWLSLELPFISHTFGYYQTIPFEFNDMTLSELLNELNLWKSKIGTETETPPVKYTININ